MFIRIFLIIFFLFFGLVSLYGIFAYNPIKEYQLSKNTITTKAVVASIKKMRKDTKTTRTYYYKINFTYSPINSEKSIEDVSYCEPNILGNIKVDDQIEIEYSSSNESYARIIGMRHSHEKRLWLPVVFSFIGIAGFSFVVSPKWNSLTKSLKQKTGE